MAIRFVMMTKSKKMTETCRKGVSSNLVGLIPMDWGLSFILFSVRAAACAQLLQSEVNLSIMSIRTTQGSRC